MQIYSKSMKNATSLFRNHNRSALKAGTYITHRVIYYPLVYLYIYSYIYLFIYVFIYLFSFVLSIYLVYI